MPFIAGRDRCPRVHSRVPQVLILPFIAGRHELLGTSCGEKTKKEEEEEEEEEEGRRRRRRKRRKKTKEEEGRRRKKKKNASLYKPLTPDRPPVLAAVYVMIIY